MFLRPGIIRWWRGAVGPRPSGASRAEESPLRLELFSLEHLERHGKALAGWHQVDERGGRNRLLARLSDNEQVLLDAYELVVAAAEGERRLSPAAEWLLDNFYLIEEQVRLARRHLPRGYNRLLPLVINGPHAGHPRVYALALELIAHVDGRLDQPGLVGFIAAYQTVAPLRLGELWAVPIMLRLALIENLRRVAARIAHGREARDEAQRWADRMIEVAEHKPADLILAVADFAKTQVVLSSAFVAEFARRLQGQSPSLSLALNWVDQRLNEQDLSIERLVQLEGQSQASDQVSIGNSIGSLRLLAAMDWREFVETLSVVEATLRCDPADAYADSDFSTRDACRHVVEETARRGRLAEPAVAERAVALARATGGDGSVHDRRRHVGWWLIGPGRDRLERE
ncbi:MAG: cyclic beta 1-2 glucan synthetase, partial [Planctomycetes bacterium]|nr:cyclic beta 1-2 glucan synthetase [Planctomycetota bacterium]